MSGPAPCLEPVARALEDGVSAGAFPAAAAAVFHKGSLVHLSSAGGIEETAGVTVPLDPDAHFDLSSLTKVLATTAATVILVGSRQIRLDERVARFWPTFARAGKNAITLRQLLAHTSGLPKWRPLFLDVLRDPVGRGLYDEPRAAVPFERACRRGRALILGGVETCPLERRQGESAVYSDLGFIALGNVLEHAAGSRLDRFVARDVFSKLGLTSLGFRPLSEPPAPGSSIVPTGLERPRLPAPGQEQALPAREARAPSPARPGEVDDDNAFAMGGIAGHAGLFGSARDVAAFGQAVLEELAGARRFARASVWETFCRSAGPHAGSRALGFDTPSPERSSAGLRIAASRAVGHLGFTGTSLWIDLRRKVSIALLTNRVRLGRHNEAIRDFRPRFHDRVIEVLES